MTEQEAFMANETIVCKPFHARISRQQCGVNASRDGGDGPCGKCPERSKAGAGETARRSAWNWGQQKTITRENTAMEEKKNYTQKDLAREAQVSSGVVCYALKLMASGRENFPPQAARVKDAMDRLGVTYQQVTGVKDPVLSSPLPESVAETECLVPVAPDTPESPDSGILPQNTLPKRRVYLGCPYSHANPAVMASRALAVRKKAVELTLQGCIVFSPITYGHAFGADLIGDWEFWKPFCLSFFDGWTQEFHVLALEGWRESVGLQAEMAVAEAAKLPTTLYFA